MKTIHSKSLLGLFLTVSVLLLLLTAYTAEAQRGGGQAGADQDRLQTQDQDRLQDGAGENCTSTGDCDGEPDQDQLRDQDRDRLQDGSGDGEPDQDRDRDRTYINSANALEQYVQEQTRVRTQAQDSSDGRLQTRTQAQVATDAVVAATPLLGAGAPRMGEVARSMNQSMSELADDEDMLLRRGRLQKFFFGYDDEVTKKMKQEAEQNRNRIEEMQQYMQECDDCDPGTVEVLKNQLQHMEQEQNRLEEVVADAEETKGVFGFLFGWMR